jgi:hypothetical protein
MDLLHGLGLSVEELVPDAPGDPHLSLVRDDDDEEDEDEDEVLMREVRRERERMMGEQRAQHAAELLALLPERDDDPWAAAAAAAAADTDAAADAAAAAAADTDAAADAAADADAVRGPRPCLWPAAAAALLTAAGMLLWLGLPPSPAPTPAPAASRVHTINRSAQVGDVSVTVCHAETHGDSTELHMHVSNISDEPRTTELSLVADDADTTEPATGSAPPQSDIVPAHSVQHRVLKVRKQDREQSVRVEVGAEDPVFVQVGTW